MGRCGGDSVVNTIRSSEPDSEAFVLSVRNIDEPAGAYVARVRLATERLTAQLADRSVREYAEPIVELED